MIHFMYNSQNYRRINKIMPNLVPWSLDQSANGERSFDIFSRLLKERVIFLTGEVNDYQSDLICAQLLF